MGLLSNNNFNKEENNVFINNNINHLNNTGEENEIKDNLLRFWFNNQLVNSKRKNIQQLIVELSNLQMKFEQYDDNEDYYDEKLKNQSDLVEKYICNQKELYRNYFKKLQDLLEVRFKFLLVGINVCYSRPHIHIAKARE